MFTLISLLDYGLLDIRYLLLSVSATLQTLHNGLCIKEYIQQATQYLALHCVPSTTQNLILKIFNSLTQTDTMI